MLLQTSTYISIALNNMALLMTVITDFKVRYYK